MPAGNADIEPALKKKIFDPDKIVGGILPESPGEEIYKVVTVAAPESVRSVLSNPVGYLRVLQGDKAEFWMLDSLNRLSVLNAGPLRQAIRKHILEGENTSEVLDGCKIMGWCLAVEKGVQRTAVHHGGLAITLTFSDDPTLFIRWKIVGVG